MIFFVASRRDRSPCTKTATPAGSSTIHKGYGWGGYPFFLHWTKVTVGAGTLFFALSGFEPLVRVTPHLTDKENIYRRFAWRGPANRSIANSYRTKT